MSLFVKIISILLVVFVAALLVLFVLPELYTRYSFEKSFRLLPQYPGAELTEIDYAPSLEGDDFINAYFILPANATTTEIDVFYEHAYLPPDWKMGFRSISGRDLKNNDDFHYFYWRDFKCPPNDDPSDQSICQKIFGDGIGHILKVSYQVK